MGAWTKSAGVHEAQRRREGAFAFPIQMEFLGEDYSCERNSAAKFEVSEKILRVRSRQEVGKSLGITLHLGWR